MTPLVSHRCGKALVHIPYNANEDVPLSDNYAIAYSDGVDLCSACFVGEMDKHLVRWHQLGEAT